MKEHWIKDIHNRLGNYEIDAPEGLWTDICNNLSKMEERRKLKSDNHKPAAVVIGMRRVAVAAIAACIAVIFYLHLSTNEHTTAIHTPTHTIAKSSMSTDKAHIDISKGRTSEAINHIGEDKLMAMADKAKGILLLDETINANSAETSSSANTDSAAAPPSLITDTKNIANNGYYPHSLSAQHTPKRHSSSSHWTISTSAMGGMGSSSATTTIADAVVAAGPEGTSWADNPMLGLAVYNQGKNVVTDVKHRLPVRLGIGVAYAIDKKLSIESGLTYTWLSSDLREGTSDNYWYGQQKLHYVGIPLNLKYQLYASRHLGIYASAGMLAEQCVAGNKSLDYVMMGELKGEENKHIHSKPFQLSANAAMGVQVDVADNIGIYAEPGVSYYFDDHSSLNTIYKDKPLNFNLNLGLRFTLNK